MSSPRRAELTERVMNLRGSMAAARNEKDRFDLAMQAKRLEAELARLQPEPPVEHLESTEPAAPPFHEPPL